MTRRQLNASASTRRRWLPALGMLLLAAPAPAAGQSEEQERAARELVERLEHAHYEQVVLDDAFSAELFERYLKLLDPSHSFLTTKDIAAFGVLRERLDDFARAGDLRAAYAIHECVHEIRLERMRELLVTVEGGLEELQLDDEESFELDRGEADWAGGETELDELWRKRLENDLLGLILSGKTTEEAEEALERRYGNSLQRLEQTTDDDVFALWMNAVATGYDPHTNYFPPRVAEDFDIQMSLSLDGIGATLSVDGEHTRVERLVPGGPAARAAELQSGDRIVAIAEGEGGEWTDVVGWRLDEVVARIRGPRESIVQLRVLSADEPIGGHTHELSITRDEVKLEEQAARSDVIEIEREGREHRIGLITLPTFYMDFTAYAEGDPDYRSSTRDVARLLREFEGEALSGLVIDLRGNGGGSLVEAQRLAGLFLGDQPVVQVRDARGRVNVLTGQMPLRYGGPMCVMVDRMSASASEIFAGAIQDYGRGLILGSRTFGKGTVQTILPLESGDLKLTQAKFYRVNGEGTQNRGIVPDIELSSALDPERIGESALDGALEWDRIRALRVPFDRSPVRHAAHLTRAHLERAAQDPELVALRARHAYFAEQWRESSVSLNEARRRAKRESKEARLLAIENTRRGALGLELKEALDEIEDPEVESGPEPHTREAANVLVDWLETSAT